MGDEDVQDLILSARDGALNAIGQREIADALAARDAEIERLRAAQRADEATICALQRAISEAQQQRDEYRRWWEEAAVREHEDAKACEEYKQQLKEAQAALAHLDGVREIVTERDDLRRRVDELHDERAREARAGDEARAALAAERERNHSTTKETV